MTITWLWAFYFTVKLWLHLTGAIRIHFWLNLGLLALAMPLSPKQGHGDPWLRRGRHACVAVLGAALFWYDSYLPPFLYAVQFAMKNTGVLTSGFMNEFAKNFFNGGHALAFFAVLALYLLAAKKGLHPTAMIFLALLIVPVQTLREPGDEAGRAAARFYRSEQGRRVHLPDVSKSPPFDIIFVHICSLSWDDLDAVAQPRPRLLQGANVIFTNFNSATSYSTPAALRLLRAPCGQVSHKELYDPWPPACGVLGRLRAAGFRTYAAFNVDPRYFGMAQDLQKMAGLDVPISVEGLPRQMLSFDDQPVFENGPVLERWRRLRESDASPRAALFFNTISLHGGGHEDKPRWWKDPPGSLYVKALDGLGADVEALERAIAASGRSAVVVIIPEHGRALRGSVVQAAGLRDIPLARITRVPAAVRLVGPLFAKAPAGLEVSGQTSYLALAQLLSDLMADPSSASGPGKLERELDQLPTTSFMAETEKWKVFQFADRSYVFGKDDAWRPLPVEAPAPEIVSK